MAFNSLTGNYDSLADTGYTAGQIDAFFSDLVRQSGASYQDGDKESLISKLVGGSGYIPDLGGDPRKAFGEFTDQYMRRGSNIPLITPSSEYLNIGTTRAALVNVVAAGPRPAPKAPTAGKSVPGYTWQSAQPPLGSVVTTLGATEGASTEPTSGPTGLAYAADPINYSTMLAGAEYGYDGERSGVFDNVGMSGGYSSPVAGLSSTGAAPAGGSNLMPYLLLGGLAIGAYLLLK